MWWAEYGWGFRDGRQNLLWCLCWLNESSDHYGLSSLHRHSEGGDEKHTQNSECHSWSLSTALAGRKSRQSTPIQWVLLPVLYFKGTVPALFLFSPVKHFPEMLLASENSSRNSPHWSAASRTHPVPRIMLSLGCRSRKRHLGSPFLPLVSLSNSPFSSFYRLSMTYTCGACKRREVCMRRLSLSQQ